MSNQTRIQELEAEVRRLRKLGRTKREPVAGIGGVVQMMREAREMGVQELAKAAGINGGAISKLEQGANANPTWSTIQALARGFKILPSQLVAGFETARK